MFRIEGEGFCSTTGHDRSSFIIRPISCFVLFYWERRSIIHSFIIFQLWLLLKPSLIFQIEVHESFLAFAWITTRTKPKWRGRKEERTRLLNEWAPNVVMKWIDPTISSPLVSLSPLNILVKQFKLVAQLRLRQISSFQQCPTHTSSACLPELSSGKHVLSLVKF